MRRIVYGWALVAATLVAGRAQAAPTLEIRGAAVRIIVVPQRRSDVSVILMKANRALPVQISHFGETVSVTGDINHRGRGCLIGGGARGVRIRGRGDFSYESLPQLVALVPMNAKVTVSEAVFGAVGRSSSLELTNSGCGDWTVANVKGALHLDQFGSGHVRVGNAGSANLSVAGAGKVDLRVVAGGLRGLSSGSGDIHAMSVSGPMNVRIAGSGDIRAIGGEVTQMSVAIAGSGTVLFGGTAAALDGYVAGPGIVTVAKVTGAVKRQVFGAGAIRIGP